MNNIKKNKVIFSIYIVLLFLLGSINFSYGQSVQSKSIGILNSYYQGHEHTKKVEQGIRSVLESENGEITTYYTDLKRHGFGPHIRRLYQTLKKEWHDHPMDMIICTDYDALKFLSNHQDLVYKTEVVFCGINDYQTPNIETYKSWAGVVEQLPLTETLHMIKGIYPRIKKINIVIDDTYNLDVKRIKDLSFLKGVSIQVNKNPTFEDIKDQLKDESKDEVMILMSSVFKGQFSTVTLQEGMKDIISQSNMPIFGFWHELLGKGIVGGRLIDSKEQGLMGGVLARKILNGEKDKLIIKGRTSQYMFDDIFIQKYGMDSKKIPSNSQIINRPLEVYAIRKERMYEILIAIIMLLSIIVLSLHWNIKARKKTEKKLSQHLKFHHKLMDTIPNPIFYQNNEAVYIGCNESFEKLVGKSRKEIMGKSVYDIFDKKLADLYYNMDHRLRLKGGIQTYEGKIHDSQKQYMDVIFNKAAYNNMNGKVDGIIGIIVDITRRKKIEQALIESKQQYNQLVELLPIGVGVFDGYRIDFINQAGVKLLGCKSKEELIGKNILNFIHENCKKWIEEREKKIQEGKYVLAREYVAMRKDGTAFNLEEAGTVFVHKNERKYLSIIRDVTSKRKAEELQKKMQESKEEERLRTEFFANLSHELRTPLNLIFGSIQLLEVDLKEAGYHKVDKKVHVLKQNAYRLLRLVNNLIDITKMDSGYYKLQLQNCNIVSVVEDITLSVAQLMDQRDIRLEFDTEVEEKIMACDPDKIERIILNLLSNALKFTDAKGKIMVHIHDRKDKIVIEVKDTGIGIPKEKLNVIFERFSQVDKTLRRNHEGSGIGLSLVQSLVHMHKGSIEVESEYLKGATFKITLPVEKVEESVSKNAVSFPKNYAERIEIEFSDIYA